MKNGLLFVILLSPSFPSNAMDKQAKLLERHKARVGQHTARLGEIAAKKAANAAAHQQKLLAAIAINKEVWPEVKCPDNCWKWNPSDKE